MKITIERCIKRHGVTVGRLYIDGKAFCWTLEDEVRPDPEPSTPQNEAKVWGETAIPEGVYSVVLNYSPKFGRIMPRLLNVPGFDGILIHSGNRPEDTQGCILVGFGLSVNNTITEGTSRPAFNRLYDILKSHDGEITLQILPAPM